MARIEAAEFRSRLRALSRPELAALVETLWEARGFDVEREEEFVVAVDPVNDRKEVLLPVAARRTDRWLSPREPRRPAVTAVVRAGAKPPAWARDDDVRVVDDDDLRELLLYGVDAETRRTLLADVFGIDPVDDAARGEGSDDGPPVRHGDESPAAGNGVRTALSTLASSGPGRSATVAAVGFLVLVGGLVGAVAFGLAPFGEVDDDVTAGSEDDPQVATPAEVTTPPPDSSSYPPGVSADGVEDPDALAAAHVSNLSSRTYTMVFRYREVGGNHTGTIRERTEVVGDTRYASTLDRAGTFVVDPANVTDPAVITSAETFANGDVHYERIRTDDGVRYRSRQVYAGNFPAHVSRSAGFVKRTLASTETRLAGIFERNGVTFYRIRFSDDERPAFEEVEGVAVVDEFGIVHLLRQQYRPAHSPNVTVTVTLEYTDFRTTELTEPEWLSEFGNETDTPSNGSDPSGNDLDTATADMDTSANGLGDFPVVASSSAPNSQTFAIATSAFRWKASPGCQRARMHDGCG